MLSVLVLTMKVSIVATRHMCILHARSMGHCCYDLGELLVSVDRDTYALISAGVVVRALMMVFELSSLSLPTPKTQISGEVPHAWPDVRQRKKK